MMPRMVPLSIIFLIASSSGGCAILSVNLRTPSEEASTTLSERNTTPTTTATSTPTLTLLPSATQTLTRTPTKTIPLIPMLPVADAGRMLLELLTDNGGCRLPCLWNIYPNESIFNEAVSILSPLTSISDSSSFDFNTESNQRIGSITPIYNDGSYYIDILFLVITYPNSDNVESISFDATPFVYKPDPTNPGTFYEAPIFNSVLFGQRLKLFMLPNILSSYGRPSSVLLLTYAPGGYPYGQIDMILFYPYQGILVHYMTVTRISGNNILGCMSTSFVELTLYPSGDPAYFTEQTSIELKTGFAEYDKYKPLEEVTSMSLDDFYHAFRTRTDKCIETPISAWPQFVR